MSVRRPSRDVQEGGVAASLESDQAVIKEDGEEKEDIAV